MTRRRALLFLGGLFAVLVSVVLLLRRDLEAAWYVHRLHRALDWKVRANAAIELGRLKARWTANDLVKRLKDPSNEVRKNCEWALAEITGWPWGIRDGPAPEYWNQHGRDFVAGKEVPPLPRVSLPEATSEGGHIEVSARLSEDRPYRLGPNDDVITVLVRVKNKTGQTLTVLHPAWEEYNAYWYGDDGSRKAIDVRPAPPSSLLIEASRTGRTIAGPIERPTSQFTVLPDEIPAGIEVELPFQFVVSRDRPDVLCETYRFDVSVHDAVLGTTEGLVTERARAEPLFAWAWSGGKEVLDRLGLDAEEVAKSGREIEGVVWVPASGCDRQGTLEDPCPAAGWKLLMPVGTVAWSKTTGWCRIESESPAGRQALECARGSSKPQDDWVFVVKGP